MNKFTKYMLVLTSSLLFSASGLSASSDNKSINKLIDYKINQEKSIVGSSIAIIENSQVKYYNFGFSNKQNKQLVTSDTIFEIGSISKTFTSLALASMVEEGKVKLTDPVQKFLPNSVKMPKRNGKEITLQTLANHTSALPRLPNNMPFTDRFDPYADYTVQMMYDFLNSYQLPRDIGEKFEYSNLAVGLLGHVLALIDHKTYQQMIADRVLKPLSMANTFVDVPNSHIKQFSDGHDAELNKTKHWQLPTLAGAGAIKSNIKDMALYLKAQINEKPLNKAISLTYTITTHLAGNAPKIGLAWFLQQSNNSSYLWHNGQTGGFHSFIGFDRKNKKGIVILSNSANGIDDIGNAYLKGTLAKLENDTFNVIKISEQKLKRLNGHYELMPGFIIHVTNEGQQLFLQATGQGRFPVNAKSELEFVNVQAQAKITFELDNSGQSKSLTLHQGGADRKAVKLSPEAVAETTKKVELTEKQLDNLRGEFQIMPNFIITTSHKNGQLIIQATGQPEISFQTKSATEFFNTQVQAKIVFEVDSKGKALSLTLFQAGQELKGNKLKK